MNNKKLIILIVIILILVGSFATYKILSSKVKNINLDNIASLVGNEYSVVFVGDMDSNAKKNIKNLRTKFDAKVYKMDVSNDELNEYLNATLSTSVTEETKPYYILYVEGKIKGIITNEISNDNFEEYVKKYFYNEIPSSEAKYTTPTNFDDFDDILNSGNLTVSVFGSNTCSYCKLLEPVINKVVEEKNIDIYYINSSTMDSLLYSKIINLDLKIPAECTKANQETTLTKGFATPMTLVIQNGKTVGCIKGYYSYNEYVSKLQDLKVLKED